MGGADSQVRTVGAAAGGGERVVRGSLCLARGRAKAAGVRTGTDHRDRRGDLHQRAMEQLPELLGRYAQSGGNGKEEVASR